MSELCLATFSEAAHQQWPSVAPLVVGVRANGERDVLDRGSIEDGMRFHGTFAQWLLADDPASAP